jgi:hypothetical protein
MLPDINDEDLSFIFRAELKPVDEKPVFDKSAPLSDEDQRIGNSLLEEICAPHVMQPYLYSQLTRDELNKLHTLILQQGTNTVSELSFVERIHICYRVTDLYWKKGLKK